MPLCDRRLDGHCSPRSGKSTPGIPGSAVVVVNVPGAGGAVGFDEVRKSERDGYKMMAAAIGPCPCPGAEHKAPLQVR